MDTKHKPTASLVIDFDNDDKTKQDNLLSRITNVLRDFGQQPISVEVVAYGSGVLLLVIDKAYFSERIIELQTQGVVFRACQNAMNKFNLTEEDLLAEVTTVPSGVGRIVKAQLEGSAYFKA